MGPVNERLLEAQSSMSNPPKLIEERVGILERADEDCQSKHTEEMKRIERVENKLIGALSIGVVVLLGIVGNIIITLLKK